MELETKEENANKINENKINENQINENKINEPEKKDEVKEEPIFPEENDQDLSALSFSSYDSIDNIKLDKMGQYTCNKCSEIPKIISTNLTTKKILIKCTEHGLNEVDIKDYILNALNYNSKNWKCSKCESVQRNCKDNFVFCQCNSVFCNECYKIHKKQENHFFKIESEKYNLRCKINTDHYDEKYIGYCFDCNTHYCKKCEANHDMHTVIPINTMYVDEKEIENIRKLNKEYRALISYYESLIRLNNLIIYSYKTYRDNYYNCYNINTIIKNYKRDIFIGPYSDTEKQIINAGEKNVNLFSYMNDLYKQELKEEETEQIEIENKFFNNYDLRVLTQMPIKNLHVLVLESNCISNIDCLKNADFPDLAVLNLNNNAISNIDAFEFVKFEENFQALLLRNNNIKDISVFGRMKHERLREIDLRNNIIDDIEVFETHKLKLLQCVYLSYNNFDVKNKRFEKAIERMKNELIEYELEPEEEGENVIKEEEKEEEPLGESNQNKINE